MSTRPSRSSVQTAESTTQSSRPSHVSDGAAAARLTPASLGYVIIAYLLVSNLDASAKWLGLFLPVMQIVWVRMLMHAVVGLIAAKAWKDPTAYLPVHPFQQIARGVLLFSATILNFTAIQFLQLAQTTAIFFLTPFLVAVLAGPFLGEWAGPRRWIAICIGFTGAMVIIQPGASGFHPAMILSLGSAASYAVYLIITRRLAYVETAQSMTILPALISAIALAPIGLWVWEPVPNLLVWVILLLTGVWGYGGHFLIVKAHQISPATALAPFHYTQLIWMVALGYIIFADIPDWATLLGGVIIIASGLYLWWRERVANRRLD